MNEIAKVISSLLLLTAGFAGASMFGPPELMDQFAAKWSTPPVDDPQSLRPLAMNTPSMPAAFPIQATQAAPITAPKTSQPMPIQQIAAFDSANPQQANQQQANQQQVMTAWNGQATASQPTLTSDVWLKGIHTSQPTPALPPLTSLQANSNQPPNNVAADATNNAWPVPNWNATNRFASQPQSTSPAATPSVTPIADSFWDRPLVGPQNPMMALPKMSSTEMASTPPHQQTPNLQPVRSQPLDQQPLNSSPIISEIGGFTPPSVPSSNLGNDYGPTPYETSYATQYEPQSPFGRVEAPAVQPVELPEGPERTHVVTDGDTLPMLAERYLGDAGRAQELYTLNSDRLTHPDLLPIGIILRTPAALRQRPMQQSARPTADPSATVWRGEAQPSANSVNPFSSISANPATSSTGQVGYDHPSELVPIGQTAELPAAPATDSYYQKDWAW